jgi:hypothetical protein
VPKNVEPDDLTVTNEGDTTIVIQPEVTSGPIYPDRSYAEAITPEHRTVLEEAGLLDPTD